MAAEPPERKTKMKDKFTLFMVVMLASFVLGIVVFGCSYNPEPVAVTDVMTDGGAAVEVNNLDTELDYMEPGTSTPVRVFLKRRALLTAMRDGAVPQSYGKYTYLSVVTQDGCLPDRKAAVTTVDGYVVEVKHLAYRDEDVRERCRIRREYEKHGAIEGVVATLP